MARRSVRFAAIILAAALLALGGFASLRAFRDRSPTLSQDDAAWLQMIRDGTSRASSVLPPPAVANPDALVYDCSEIPATASLGQAVIETNNDGTGRRVLYAFTDFATVPEGKQYTLVVPWDAPVQTCRTDAMTGSVNGPWSLTDKQAAADATQRYICGQVQLMADGRQNTDPSLLRAPPAVAREYLKAFCSYRR